MILFFILKLKGKNNKKMRTRTWLLCLSVLILFGACTREESTTDAPPPNILFLIADDWSFPHAGVYGDPVVRTPTFDALARQGVYFTNAYCAAPSCSPSRAAILTGRYPHQLESGGNLWSVLPVKFPNWVKRLEEAGYHTGKSLKGWGPGDFQAGGYEVNPAGKDYPDFATFLEEKQAEQPFCFWYGSTDPHRDYETNAGVRSGMKIEEVEVPGFLPDLDCVRNDILDYYYEVERFDRECGQLIARLEREGLLDNTLIIMTSDNGMPFPRAKANLYDYGTRMPLAIYWKGQITGGKQLDAFVNFIDFGPTILEAAGQAVPDAFSGTSLFPLIRGEAAAKNARQEVFLERERHANVRKGNLSYPVRGLRTDEYLYLRNFEPDRWPAGDPTTHKSVGQYGDVDNSITKYLIMDMEGQEQAPDYFRLTFGKRPAEELYHLPEDPYQLRNLAQDPGHQAALEDMRSRLEVWMRQTSDRRLEDPNAIYWDTVLYTPSYQFGDFDLEERLQDYEMLRSRGANRFSRTKCQIQ